MVETELYELLRIGLTKGEAKVYIALLELDSSTVGPIVKKAGVAYSNIYEILKRLTDKGIVSYIIKNKTKYFQACNPTNLSRYLEEKEKKILEQKEALNKALPNLNKYVGANPKQEAEIFVGYNGLRTAYERMNTKSFSDNIWYFFYIHDKEVGHHQDSFYFSIENLIGNIKSKVLGVCDLNSKDSKFCKNMDENMSFVENRYVDFPIPGNIDIVGDMICIVSWKDPIMGVLIHSKSMAESFITYFNSTWTLGKKRKDISK